MHPMFSISFVCTGNRCRSATAEALLRLRTSALPIEISSCGILDVEGSASPVETREAVSGLGGDLSAHRSRALARCDLGVSDLTIGFEHRHVAAAVVDGGADPRRTFLFPELLRLLEKVTEVPSSTIEERARLLIESADRARGPAKNFVPDEEIVDPMGRSAKVHRRTAEQIDSLCGQLAGHLFRPLPDPEVI